MKCDGNQTRFAGLCKGSKCEMFDAIQKLTDESQKFGKEGFDAALRSYGELNRGLQAIAAKTADYAKKSFEDGTRAFEQLLGAKSLEQAIEIQSTYAKKAYDAWVAEATKLSELYVNLARDAYKPVEQVVKKAPKSVS
jgi:phasin family protein